MKNKKTPDFFIVGAPKCGTTSIATWLARHKQVDFSKIKEPHFFSDDLKNQQIKSENEYFSLFSGDSTMIRGEASVWYLYSETAIDKIISKNPNAKFIVGLRNPIELFDSLFYQFKVSLNEDVDDKKEAWELQYQRENNIELIPKNCREPKLLRYYDVCSLGVQIERLFRLVSKENVYLYTLNELKDDKRKVFYDIQDFLNIDRDDSIILDDMNQASTRRSIYLHQIFLKLIKVKKILGIPRFGTNMLSWINTLNQKPLVKKEIEKEFLSDLKQIFQSEIKLISRLTGKDV